MRKVSRMNSKWYAPNRQEDQIKECLVTLQHRLQVGPFLSVFVFFVLEIRFMYKVLTINPGHYRQTFWANRQKNSSMVVNSEAFGGGGGEQ
jgi:hypothetical protein